MPGRCGFLLGGDGVLASRVQTSLDLAGNLPSLCGQYFAEKTLKVTLRKRTTHNCVDVDTMPDNLMPRFFPLFAIHNP
jgi:hypothetical protein